MPPDRPGIPFQRHASPDQRFPDLADASRTLRNLAHDRYAPPAYRKAAAVVLDEQDRMVKLWEYACTAGTQWGGPNSVGLRADVLVPSLVTDECRARQRVELARALDELSACCRWVEASRRGEPLQAQE